MSVDYHVPGYWAEYHARPEVKARRAAQADQRKAQDRARRKRRAAARRLVKAAELPHGGTWMQGPCNRCGAEVVQRFHPHAVGYCTERCKRKDAKARRKARQHGVDIVPGQRWRVFRLADWCCHICGLEIPKDAEVPALDAGVVDHVVPLARGGAHAPENWAAAHFWCNSVKADHDLDQVA